MLSTCWAGTHTHTQGSVISLCGCCRQPAAPMQGSARGDWYLGCLWSAAAHQLRLQWERCSSWPNLILTLSLPVIASVCLLLARAIFRDPDVELPSTRSEAAPLRKLSTLSDPAWQKHPDFPTPVLWVSQASLPQQCSWRSISELQTDRTPLS